MKILDATFLIDYLEGDETTKEFYHANGGTHERWVIPVPAYVEVLVGEGSLPDGDVAGARDDLAWGEPYAVDEHTAVLAGEIASEIGPQGPFLDVVDGVIAAVGRELDAPVVSDDGDLTHEATKKVVDIEEYRD